MKKLAVNTPNGICATPDLVPVGVIIATGPERAILNSFTSNKKIDLKQAVIYPGFIDAHAHFTGYALSLLTVDLVGTTSYKDVLNRVELFAADHPSGWITGRGWDQTDWSTTTFPTLTLLDELFPSRPVAIRRIDGHALLANSAALKLAGLSKTRLPLAKNDSGKEIEEEEIESNRCLLHVAATRSRGTVWISGHTELPKLLV